MTEIPLSVPGYRLRSFREDDVEALVLHANDVEVVRWLRERFPHPYTADDGRAWIEMAQDDDPPTRFAIADEEGLVGGIGLEPGEDVYRHSAELGYWLGRRHWSRGVVTAATRAMCAYGFEELGLRRIWAHVFAPNVASARVLEKCGFELEGRLREGVVKDGRSLDELAYALLAEVR